MNLLSIRQDFEDRFIAGSPESLAYDISKASAIIFPGLKRFSIPHLFEHGNPASLSAKLS